MHTYPRKAVLLDDSCNAGYLVVLRDRNGSIATEGGIDIDYSFLNTAPRISDAFHCYNFGSASISDLFMIAL